jgi:oxygen-dependent protoporphyrinogen oxidase
MTPLRVVVVGGGIAGLAAAHRLIELARDARRSLDLVVSGGRLAGRDHPDRTGGRLPAQAGPTPSSPKPWAPALAERIGSGPGSAGP